MQYEEFKQAVESGQLSPRTWQDYQQYKSLWMEMVAKGDCLDILLASQCAVILVQLVKHGHVKHPERWINGTRAQQKALIHNDLYIEELLQDGEPRIRLAIGYLHREFLPDLLKDESVQSLMKRSLLNKVKPEPELVQLLLDALPQTIPNTYENLQTRALELKLQEQEQPMTAIECTMDVQQLYSVQSKHWHQTLTGRQIVNILYAEYHLQDKELVASEFETLYDAGDFVSISTKVDKLKQEHRIGLPSQE
jgi:hypothetical protein